MGGKKKLSLKQMEKSEKKKAPQKEKRSTTASTEKKSVPGITPPSLAGDRVAAELKKLKFLTPYSVASRFELRLSVAKELLRDLERKGLVRFVSKSPNVTVYAPAD
jgi:small subunit ribosomal protein S25e